MGSKLSNLFKLSKHYFDAIDAEGRCWIIYMAQLKLGIFTIPYCSYIYSSEENLVEEKSVLKSFVEPQNSSKQLSFSIPSLGVKGVWFEPKIAYKNILWTHPKRGDLLWDCHHPSAKVILEFAGKKYEAKGYAETIYLPVNPLALPLSALRWGRFIGEEFTLVWIEWEGKLPKNLAYVNGQLVNDAVHREDGFSFAAGAYDLQYLAPIVLRKGKLGSIIQQYAFLKWLFKGSLLNSEEVKWKSKSALLHHKKQVDLGWSLYEKVKLLT